MLMAIDPAKSSGVALFDDDGRLFETVTIKPRGNMGKWYYGNRVCGSRLEAWMCVYGSCYIGRVVIERGFGNRPTAVRSQGMHIGYHQCMAEWIQRPQPVQINVSEWRRVIKEDCGVSWPRSSDRCKDLACKLVRDLYGVDVPSDEADAVLIGRAALRMGM